MKILWCLVAVVTMAFAGIAQQNTIKADTTKPVTVKDADGNVYHTVKIGNQIWTLENWRATKYNDGTPIPRVDSIDLWYNTLTPAYCSYQNTTKADDVKKFGYLYNWYAVDTRKLAPKGWHVPTDIELDTLQEYLIANGYNWNRKRNDNKTAKSMAAKTDWVPDENKLGVIGNDLAMNNRSGFSALPAGYIGSFGGFAGRNLYGCWWCATEYDGSTASSYLLFSSNEAFGKKKDKKYCGFSVRLVKD